MAVADVEIYITAQVNCLPDRRESRLISAFFKNAEDLKARRAGGSV